MQTQRCPGLVASRTAEVKHVYFPIEAVTSWYSNLTRSLCRKSSFWCRAFEEHIKKTRVKATRRWDCASRLCLHLLGDIMAEKPYTSHFPKSWGLDSGYECRDERCCSWYSLNLWNVPMKTIPTPEGGLRSLSRSSFFALITAFLVSLCTCSGFWYF